ncbi:MAG: NFACT family protein [Chloroflexi bacterium]|nr:NFACT family protein [Chloroflexota bacterium]
MYLDALTLSALLDEFMDTIVGGKIQDAIDVDENGIGLEIYSHHIRRYLYLSADNQTPRIHLVEDKLRRGLPKPTQLGLLFRRYVEGGGLLHVHQPPWERVLTFDITGPEGDATIVIEPMERRANLLLVQEGIVLDCLRRVGAHDNRVRVSLPGRPYVPPPPQLDKFDPFIMTPDEVSEVFSGLDDPSAKAAQALTRKVLGMSPLLAREIVFRAHGKVTIPAAEVDPSATFDALQTLMGPLKRREWQPGVVEQDGRIRAFSVYPLTHLEGWSPVESVSKALADYYGAPVGPEAYTAAKAPIKAAIAEARAKSGAKLASLQQSMTDDSEREQLKLAGELILAYQYTVQSGQTELKAEYEADKPALVIQLNPDLSPLENAQAYFSRYNKAKRALDDVPALIRATRNELDHLTNLDTDLDLAANWPEIDEVQGALVAAGYWRGAAMKRLGGGGASGPLRLVTHDGSVIWVGRNSRQNEIVTFGKANSEDLWLHVRGVPGAHVVIKMDGGAIPDKVIHMAASLAAHYSALRDEAKVPVDVTRVKYVRKIKGAAQGMVTYRNESTLTVEPSDEKSLPEILT